MKMMPTRKRRSPEWRAMASYVVVVGVTPGWPEWQVDIEVSMAA